MAKSNAASKPQQIVGEPKEAEIRAAMGKAIRELKRYAKRNNIKLAVAGKNAWKVPK